MMEATDAGLGAVHEQIDQSGFARLLDMRLVELGTGYAVASMCVGEQLDNWMGRTHGGAIMALADQAMGAAGATLAGSRVAIQFNINFLSPCPKGEEVFATARVVHAGRRVAMLECEVRDGNGRLLARAQATGLLAGSQSG